MSNIEPTEEQKQAAREWQDGVEQRRSGWPTLALFLAEREAKLHKQLAFMEAGSLADYNAFAEALQKEDAYMAEIATLREVDERKSRMLCDRDVVIDTLRARVADLEASVTTFHEAWKSAEADCNAQVKRVAELETYDPNWTTHNAQIERIAALEAREAQHLADIKALRGYARRIEQNYDHDLDAHKYGTGCRCCLAEEVLAATAHYDDAKADASAMVHDPQEPPAQHDCLSPAPCPTCGPFTEGGEG